MQPAYRQFPAEPLPVTSIYARRAIGLPFWQDLSEAADRRLCAALSATLPSRATATRTTARARHAAELALGADHELGRLRHARPHLAERDVLWAQVRRTVRGRPVDPEQIDLIVPGHPRSASARARGHHRSTWHAATAPSPPGCIPIAAHRLGVDLSPYLIEVAQERFATQPARASWSASVRVRESCTPPPSASPRRSAMAACRICRTRHVARLLRALHARFPGISPGHAGQPARPRARRSILWQHLPDLAEPRSDLGVWRSAGRARRSSPDRAGELSTSDMPAGFFAAHYRFDAVLVRRQ